MRVTRYVSRSLSLVCLLFAIELCPFATALPKAATERQQHYYHFCERCPCATTTTTAAAAAAAASASTNATTKATGAFAHAATAIAVVVLCYAIAVEHNGLEQYWL